MKHSQEEKSYSEVVRSSMIIGGSQGISYLIRILQVKIVAILLGPTGVGLLGLFRSALDLVKTVSGLGVNQSGVRNVAEARSRDDATQIAKTVKVLRRVCWLTGFFGIILSVLLAKPISQWVFSSDKYAFSIGLLGIAVLFYAVSAGQLALLRGLRRLKELAKYSIISAVLNLVVSAILYFTLGRDGIIPALTAGAFSNLLISWLSVREIQVEPISITWFETFEQSKSLLSLGLTFMWGASLATVVALVLRGAVTRDFGLGNVGIYQAAWGLSGMFATFLIQAMSADFFPRLTGVADKHEKVNQFVVEQMEIGILFALPGFLLTIVFAPFLLVLMYSREFVQGAELLNWFTVGISIRVIGWPIGMIQRAKGAVKWIMFSSTWGHGCNLGCSLLFMSFMGLKGIGVGFVVFQLIQLVIGYLIGRRLTGFHWSREVMKLVGLSVLSLLICLGSLYYLSDIYGRVVGSLFAIVIGVFCLRELVARLGEDHKLVKQLFKLPFTRRLCSVRESV